MTNGHINPANVPDIALKDGHSIPQVGLGVLRIDDEGVVPVVESALEAGYRHIDGAAGYNNEAGVGRALAASGYNKGAKRETLWVTTKLRDSQQGYDSALKAFDNSLKLLQLDYVDMYMIHWPTPFDWRSTDTWKAFVKLRDEGMARTLGVCNFMPADLKRLHEETGAWPAVNQIELHPTWQQREVVAFCKKYGIAVEAYSPMARGADLNAGDGTIEKIAAALPEMFVCAGTVLSVEQAKLAVDCGAKAVISPGTNREVVEWCLKNQVPVYPGCATPTEVEAALGLGLTTVKLFPAEVVGGVKMLKALYGPYRGVKFMPTGGISPSNVKDYLSQPNVIACGGSWLCPAGDINEGNWVAITQRAKECMALVQEVRAGQ